MAKKKVADAVQNVASKVRFLSSSSSFFFSLILSSLSLSIPVLFFCNAALEFTQRGRRMSAICSDQRPAIRLLHSLYETGE
jgi:hypothetical protein